MNPWVESLGVLTLAAGGMFIGAWFSRRPKPWWMIGYFFPLSLVILFDIALHHPALSFVPPLSWIMFGRTKIAATGFIAAMVLTTPLLKLPKRRDRLAVTALMISTVLGISVWPVLAPAFNEKQLRALITSIDSDGVCHQTTDYTCGPAAAVTALRKLGIKADESELALLAHTSSATGTPADILAGTLQEHYGSAGLVCEYRAFNNVTELKDCCPTLAVVKFNPILDHYVTVLAVNNRAVIVGDPLQGIETLSIADFNAKWRFTGVVIRRK